MPLHIDTLSAEDVTRAVRAICFHDASSPNDPCIVPLAIMRSLYGEEYRVSVVREEVGAWLLADPQRARALLQSMIRGELKDSLADICQLLSWARKYVTL